MNIQIIETDIKEGDQLNCVETTPLPGNDIGPDLNSETKYEAKEVYTCKCGQKHIDVGLVSSRNWINCYACSEKLPRATDGGIQWCHPRRFTIA